MFGQLSDMARVAAVDPGMTTGLLLVQLDGGGEEEVVATEIGIKSWDDRYERHIKNNEQPVGTEYWDYWKTQGRLIEIKLASSRVDLVVVEDFVVQPAVLQGRKGSADRDMLAPIAIWTAALASMEANGWEPEILYQMPSEAKGLITNERMKSQAPEIYKATRGRKHARDAARHYLLFLRKASEAGRVERVAARKGRKV